MNALVRSIDRRLQKKLGVFEFSQDPDCIFRVSFDRADRQIALPDRVIDEGERVAKLHYWNDRLPVFSDGDSNLAFGQRMLRMVVRSNKMIASELDNNPEWAGVCAVGMTTALFGNKPGSRDPRMWARIGYTILDYENPHGEWAEFWERVWAWALWRAYQSGTRRVPPLSEIRRCEIWASADELRRRFSKGSQ